MGFGGTGGGTASFVPELERVIETKFCGFFTSWSLSFLRPTLDTAFSSGMHGLSLGMAWPPFSHTNSLLRFGLLSCLLIFSSALTVVAGGGCLLHLTAVIRAGDRGNPPEVTDLNSIVSGSISRSSEDKRPEASPLH